MKHKKNTQKHARPYRANFRDWLLVVDAWINKNCKFKREKFETRWIWKLDKGYIYK